MTCSESASSFQSVSQTSTPEILIGLVYNATTGRLSVEIIKGVHFKNLAANKPPSKYSKWFLLHSYQTNGLRQKLSLCIAFDLGPGHWCSLRCRRPQVFLANILCC